MTRWMASRALIINIDISLSKYMASQMNTVSKAALGSPGSAGLAVFSTEPLRRSDHPLVATWMSARFGVRTANYSSSDQVVSLGITSANIQYGTSAVANKAGGAGQEGIWFNRVIGSTLAGDRIDFSALDPRSMFVGYSPTTPLGVKVNLGTESAVIGSLTLSGLGAMSWGCQVQNFEDVIGSAFHDSLIGNADANRLLGGDGNDTLDGGAGVDVLTGGAGDDRFVLGDRGALHADRISDFTAYRVRTAPGASPGLIEDDALILANRLDDGLVGSSTAGIKGLTFTGGNVAGKALAPASFFKGVGFTGASLGAAAGIYVNSSSGDVFYNDATEAGSHLIARLGTAGVAGIGASDVLLG